MLNPDETALVNFVYETAPSLPVKRRTAVYRGLSDCLDDIPTREVFKGMVRILEEAEAKCADLQFPPPGNPAHDGDGNLGGKS